MIDTSRSDGIHTIRMSHGKANALDVELLAALRAELRAAADARAIILTGTGSIFCAGVDLFRLVAEGPAYVREFYPALSGFMRELFELPIPVVAASNGHAIAGGALMVLSSDYRLMAAGRGRIGIPELLVGVPFPAVAIEMARFAIPPHRIQSLMFGGQTLLAPDALESGLLDEVVEPERLDARALDVATQLARIPAENFSAAKRALRAPFLERIDARDPREEEATAALWESAGTHARIRDYLAALPRR